MNSLFLRILIVCIFYIIIFIKVITVFATYNYIIEHLSNYVYNIAKHIVIYNFKKNNKSIYTKREEYTVNFLKTLQSKIIELNMCQFYSQDFYNYYKQHRPILKNNIYKLIYSYIKNYSGILLNNNFNNMTPEHFFKLKKTIQGDMVGVYVLYNKNKRMYYVGQATRLFFRVNQHFTGHGNGDVYSDYKRGKDKFIIKLIPLVNSGYYDLDKLEKDMITKYDSYNNGYNKTIGNGNY